MRLSVPSDLSRPSVVLALAVLVGLATPAASQVPSGRPAAAAQEKPTGAIPAPQRLKGEEIRALITDRTGRFITADGRISGTNLWRANGELSATTKILGFTKTISGTWTVEGDRFCKDVFLDFVNSRCQAVVRMPDASYRFVNEDGSVASTVTFGP